jgi:hypothetical protein
MMKLSSDQLGLFILVLACVAAGLTMVIVGARTFTKDKGPALLQICVGGGALLFVFGICINALLSKKAPLPERAHNNNL